MPLVAPTSGPVGDPDPPISVEEFSHHVGAHGRVDPAMRAYLLAGVDLVEGACGPIAGGPWQWLVNVGAGARTIILPVGGITEVTAVADPDGLDRSADFRAGDVDWAGGLLRVSSGRSGPWLVTVVHARTAGATERLKIAALMIAKKLWETQRGTATTVGRYGDTVPIPASFVIPNAAREAMAPDTGPVVC